MKVFPGHSFAYSIYFLSYCQGSPSSHPSGVDNHSSVFGRFRTKYRSSSTGEENLGCRTVDLHTSTIKLDAEDTDLRLCFRIISPLKSYTLQVKYRIVDLCTQCLNWYIKSRREEHLKEEWFKSYLMFWTVLVWSSFLVYNRSLNFLVYYCFDALDPFKF